MGEVAHPPSLTRMNLGADSDRGTNRDTVGCSLLTDLP